MTILIILQLIALGIILLLLEFAVIPDYKIAIHGSRYFFALAKFTV